MTRLNGSTLFRGTLVLVAAVGMAASIAQAQPPANDPLKGPKVQPRDVPGDHGQFGEARKDKKGGNVEIPRPMFMRIINATLGADDAAVDIKLTDAQREKIKTLNDDFEKKAREYRQAHAKEFAEMQKEMGGAPGRGGADRKPGKGAGDAPAKRQAPDAAKPGDEMAPAKEMTPEQREKVIDKYRELREGAPMPEDVRTAIWTQLSDPQKKAVQTKIDAVRDDMLKRRADAETQRKLKKQGDGDSKQDAKREEMRKKLEGMTPEEREKAIQEMRKRRQDKQPGEPLPAPTPPK
ncbi:MAG: hypothetical protein ACREJO_08625 [Phycisphaerales bacterium]